MLESFEDEIHEDLEPRHNRDYINLYNAHMPHGSIRMMAQHKNQ